RPRETACQQKRRYHRKREEKQKPVFFHGKLLRKIPSEENKKARAARFRRAVLSFGTARADI
ncbi:MAG: hypothetical protein LBK44_05685, partial [Spirochaetales bacterium]|nr:hypothetical protein [Spirochaetales bacterium]